MSTYSKNSSISESSSTKRLTAKDHFIISNQNSSYPDLNSSNKTSTVEQDSKSFSSILN
jgi:hypothetical protein